MRPQIEIAHGGTLYADLPAVPTSGTLRVTIKRASGCDLDDTAVVDTVVTDPLHISLVAGAGSIGDLSICTPGLLAVLYPAKGETLRIVSGDTGQTQTTQIRDIDAQAERIYLRKPLTAPVGSGDILLRSRVSITLSAEQCPRIEQNHRAVFSALADGARITSEVIYDVGLRPSRNPASVVDLDSAWPDMHLSVPVEWIATEADTALAEGWRAVCQGLRAARRNPNRVRDDSVLVPLIVARALRHMARFGHVPAIWQDALTDWIKLLDEEYAEDLQQVLSGLLWYDDDDQGTVGGESETHPAMPTITLAR